MKRIAIYAAVMLASSAGTSFAQSKDVAYSCVGEAAGGLWYNQQTNKWESHSFIPSQKFVLKIKFPGARVRKEHLRSRRVTTTSLLQRQVKIQAYLAEAMMHMRRSL